MRVSRLPVILAPFWLAAALAAGDVHASVVPLGPPIRVDGGQACREQVPDVAGQPDGGFVAVWSEDGKVRVRRFDAAGRAVGEELGAASSAGPQTLPAVAADGEGRFVVAWYEDSAKAVRARRFSAAGTPLGEAFEVGPQPGPGGGLDVAAAADGAFAVAWAHPDLIEVRAFAPEGAPLGPPGVAAFIGTFAGPAPRFTELALAAHGGGDFALVATLAEPRFFHSSQVYGRWLHFGPAGLASSNLDLLTSPLSSGGNVAAAPGGFVAAWRQSFASAPGIFARRFDAAGKPLGEHNVRVDEGTWKDLGTPGVALDRAGNAVVVWPGTRPDTGPDKAEPAVFARSLDTSGAAAGAVVELSQTDFVRGVAAARAGEVGIAAVWQEEEHSVLSSCDSLGLFARRLGSSCAAGPGQLCLLSGRFLAEVAWEDPAHARTGAGRAVGLTDQSGYFWFFDEKNVELMVKAVDGRAVNRHFWIFYGALSDVPYTLTVTDTATGQVRQYQNRRFELASKADTAAFPDGGGSQAVAANGERASIDDADLQIPQPFVGLAQPAGAVAASSAARESAAGPCSDPALPVVPRPGLCLSSRRFEVEVDWRDPVHGTSGSGIGVPLTDDSGYFWFFSPGNVELVFKVVDGRPVNGSFWVFSGALTDVEYTLRVRHASGAERVYHNPPFQLRSFADTGAFALPAD